MANPDYGVHRWGGYLVRRVEDGQGEGDIVIYRIVHDSPTKADIPRGQEFVTQIGEQHVAGRSCGRIEAPEEGWDSEIQALPESIFGGYE